MDTTNIDVVIVGGGPIGLAHAWGIKKLNPHLNVLVFEKYQEYQRKHTLIMQPAKLKKLMRATGTEQDPALSRLYRQLKRKPHITTSALEEIFKQLAIDNGVHIIVEQVQDASIHEQIFTRCKNARLIIGADGTHSTVNRALFPTDNQVKHEFDYVLQLRYEINGEAQAEALNPIDFYQHLARHGLVASEFIGRFENGKTPVTMQMMISKQAFLNLQNATSKNPIKPFAIDQLSMPELPQNISAFINEYLTYKIQACHLNRETIDQDSIRISVNEAPATHAKQVINTAHPIPVILVGDAGLGLSYFKGLNAGLESTARFLSQLAPTLRQGLSNPLEMRTALQNYQTWFLEDFAPRKIKEVSQFSTRRIRSAAKIMEVARGLKRSSMVEHFYDPEPLITDYFSLLAQDPLAETIQSKSWHAYPHRAYDPVKLGQFAYVPLQHTQLKIKKLFVDYFKPYKSSFQLRQDFKQPLVGVVNISAGLAKLIVGIFTLNIKRFGDGLLTLFRGTLELLTTPMAWCVKPITRGIATLIRGPITIENNHGLKRVARHGYERLNEISAEEFSAQEAYDLLAVCNDLHRKFDKADSRGQTSTLKMEEHTRFAALRADTVLNKHKVLNYFSLFHRSELDLIPSMNTETKENYVAASSSRSTK